MSSAAWPPTRVPDHGGHARSSLSAMRGYSRRGVPGGEPGLVVCPAKSGKYLDLLWQAPSLRLVKRRELLSQMAGLARSYGIEFDKDHPVHGGTHDKHFVVAHAVEVPRHAEIAEYTARGILRTFGQLCAQAATEERA